MAKLSTVFGVLILTGLGSASFAGDPGTPGKFYAGFDAGPLRTQARLSPEFFSGSELHQSGNSVGFKVRAGFQFVRFLALEGGYANFGDFELKNVPYSCPPGGPASCTYDVKSSTNAYFLNMVFTWSFTDKWLANGRAGIVRVKDITRERAPDISPADAHTSVNSTGAVFGVGLGYRISPQVEVELAWTRFGNYGNDNGFFADIPRFDLEQQSHLTFGARYRF